MVHTVFACSTMIIHTFLSAVEEGGEDKGNNNDVDATNSDSGSVGGNNDVETSSVVSDKDVTMPTLESLEPETNG